MLAGWNSAWIDSVIVMTIRRQMSAFSYCLPSSIWHCIGWGDVMTVSVHQTSVKSVHKWTLCRVSKLLLVDYRPLRFCRSISSRGAHESENTSIATAIQSQIPKFRHFPSLLIWSHIRLHDITLLSKIKPRRIPFLHNQETHFLW